ncbi:hypothetical protein NPX99_06495 [Bartonella sp. 220]|uniref:hypothetical protein n=1 Tax=Bartonella sp. 220B TaxID=2967260 RepID=UPI0022A93130|nr:hypothetical protein [Bartonella sp. 220B]MCZ2158916.1 hypothetical protein [Bartonella sp. 220B]
MRVSNSIGYYHSASFIIHNNGCNWELVRLGLIQCEKVYSLLFFLALNVESALAFRRFIRGIFTPFYSFYPHANPTCNAQADVLADGLIAST